MGSCLLLNTSTNSIFFVLEGGLVVAIYVMSVWPAMIDRATVAYPAITATTMTIVNVAEVWV